MVAFDQKHITIFLMVSLLAIVGIVISSIVMISQNGMNARLQGWVNLLWLPLPIVILIIDRICVRKFGAGPVNKIEAYILGILVIGYIVHWIRLRL